MEQVIKYFLKLSFILFVLVSVWDTHATMNPIRFSYQNPPDSIAGGDTSQIDLPYPLDPGDYPFDGTEKTGGLLLNDPSNITTTVEYDPINNEYIFYKKIGDLNYSTPNTMSFEELDLDQHLLNALNSNSRRGFPVLYTLSTILYTFFAVSLSKNFKLFPPNCSSAV